MREYHQKSTQKSQLQVAATNETASYNTDATTIVKNQAIRQECLRIFPDLESKGQQDLLPVGNEKKRKNCRSCG
jgi:hypothetical protein